MKRYVIDEDICRKSHLEPNLVFTILLLRTGKTYEESIKELLERGILVKDGLFENQYLIKNRWANILSEMFLNAEKGSIEEVEKYDERLKNLALQLIDIFPKGKKDGTTLFWRCNKMEIKQRLKKFFRTYGEYTDDEIINATKEYVNMHNGGDTTMRILKYFIIKDDVSDLASMLENKGQNNVKNDIGELI